MLGIVDSGTKIVTNGLIEWNDSAQLISYTGAGTNWVDISGNTKNAALINGPTFNTASGGSIVFDGVDDHATFSGSYGTVSSFNYSPGTSGEVSLEIWIYPTGPYTIYNAEGLYNLAGVFGQTIFQAGTGYGLGIQSLTGTPTTRFFMMQVRSGPSVGTSDVVLQPGSTASSSFTDNNWYHVVGTFERSGSARVYVNGVEKSSVSSTTANGRTITPSSQTAGICRQGAAAFSFYTGARVAITRIYNRNLTSTEVAQNFNAERIRFGI